MDEEMDLKSSDVVACLQKLAQLPEFDSEECQCMRAEISQLLAVISDEVVEKLKPGFEGLLLAANPYFELKELPNPLKNALDSLCKNIREYIHDLYKEIVEMGESTPAFPPATH